MIHSYPYVPIEARSERLPAPWDQLPTNEAQNWKDRLFASLQVDIARMGRTGQEVSPYKFIYFSYRVEIKEKRQIIGYKDYHVALWITCVETVNGWRSI